MLDVVDDYLVAPFIQRQYRLAIPSPSGLTTDASDVGDLGIGKKSKLASIIDSLLVSEFSGSSYGPLDLV